MPSGPRALEAPTQALEVAGVAMKIEMVVEVSKGSRNKCEVDSESDAIWHHPVANGRPSA
jgi:hypothetical protein